MSIKMKIKGKKIISFTLGILVMFLASVGQFPINLFNNTITASAAVLNTARVAVHDPGIVKANGKYYLFGSHKADAVSTDLASWKNFQINVNSDCAKIFSVGAKWASHGSDASHPYDINGNLWAPAVIYNPAMKKWCMYMSVNGDKYYSSIALATSDNIEGPYAYVGTVVYSGFTNSSQAGETDYKTVIGTNTVDKRYLANGAWNASYGPNAIDPCVVYDKNGDLWMSYGSWFGGLFMLKLNKSTGLRDYSYTYATKTNSSDQYFGIKISGGYGTSGEGSYIVYDKSAGYYYLYESYCGLDATDNFSGYHIRLFRSKNITGPYVDASGNSAICQSSSDDKTTKGIKLFGNYSFSSLKSLGSSDPSANGYMSGGHNSAFIDDSGQRYLVYHTRFNNGTEWHQVRVHQQFLNEDGWPVTAVYENLGSSIASAGYSSNDIVGTYEFVNHGLDATTTKIGMLKTSKVSLNSDGTITGDYTGTWNEKSGTYYCTMAIGGVTYKGVFFKQYDESSSHNVTMTFSLIGSNDESIWGSKISNSTIGQPKLDGTYYIKSSLSGLYLDIANGSSADGTNLQQWNLLKNNAQKFKLVSDANGYYSILTGASNYKSCIDVEKGSSADGAKVEEWNYWGGDMQKFKIIKVSNNKYAILTKSSNFKSCLDVYNMGKDAGTKICQWNYWGGEGQLWELVTT